jgi:NAD(P)-dependent dehydrogenase (short-subunit alcohol dehydrogenase family)
MGNNIEGKVVVITGGSSGLGAATARLLFEQGAIVALGGLAGHSWICRRPNPRGDFSGRVCPYQ